MDLTLPFSEVQLRRIIAEHPTPFHLYYEKGIRENARELLKAFDWAKFKQFFAVKACPNPHILRILHEEGFGADCSSLPELIMAGLVGIVGQEVMFTSNNTPAEEFVQARSMGARINLDDITHIPYLAKHAGLPDLICFRYNPGPLRGGNAIIGQPEEAKYGFTKPQLFEGYRLLRDQGIEHFGLHTMVASNELNPQYFIDTARMLFDLVVEINQELGINFEFVNLGGGIGIPYRPEQEPVDLRLVAEGVRDEYQDTIVAHGLDPIEICMENGRMITGPYGFLVTKARHIMSKYKEYIGLDACMADLMRPALYGAYHHITVIGKENPAVWVKRDVVGSLCENNDKFAIDRMVPEIEPDDLVIIHCTGAHGYAMGFNYNGKLKHAELLLREDGSVIEIRRAETITDLFATLNFNPLW